MLAEHFPERIATVWMLDVSLLIEGGCARLCPLVTGMAVCPLHSSSDLPVELSMCSVLPLSTFAANLLFASVCRHLPSLAASGKWCPPSLIGGAMHPCCAPQLLEERLAAAASQQALHCTGRCRLALRRALHSSAAHNCEHMASKAQR